MIYEYKFPVSDVIIKNFILLNLELEVEAENLPEIDDLTKVEITVKNLKMISSQL